MKKIDWHKTALKKHLKGVLVSGATYIILVLVFLLWRFALGIKFEWQQIEPLSPPTVFIRVFYSAFTFWTLGRLVYLSGFYKLLHNIVVKVLGLWGLYNFIKAVVWTCLIFVSYQYIVPWAFGVLNSSISILYNIVGIVLYVLPPLGISLMMIALYFIWKNKPIFLKKEKAN